MAATRRRSSRLNDSASGASSTLASGSGLSAPAPPVRYGKPQINRIRDDSQGGAVFNMQFKASTLTPAPYVIAQVTLSPDQLVRAPSSSQS